MKNYKIFIFSIVVALFASCSKDSSSGSSSGSGTTPVVVDNTPVSGQFQKRVLIEDYTGTWCGWCPRVAYGIGKVYEQTTKAVAVAIHQKSGSSDPYDYPAASPLVSQINLQGYPTGMLNRTVTWNYPENSNTGQVKNLILNNVGLGLAMKSTVSGGNINLDVKIKFASDYTGLKLVVYVLEDNLYYNQTNYTSNLYGSGTVSPLVSFKHDRVLRANLTNVLGDAITETTASGQTITKNFSVPVPANISNVANMNFVAFVIGTDKKAINVRAAASGEDQLFEQNP
jgi:hypothetical protein